MKKNIMLILGCACLLASCNVETRNSSSAASSTPSYDISWVSPTGIPTLAFYDQGANANWVSTAEATSIPPLFANDNNDFLVFDGTGGLTQIVKNNRNYQFARWISMGDSFCVVSTKHNTLGWDDAYTVDAFVPTGNAGRAFVSLATNNWGWTNINASAAKTGCVSWENGVADVRDKLLANHEAYDYYVIAEPVRTAVATKLKAEGVTLNTVANLQTEWGKYHENGKIPGAGLFVNKTRYSQHKGALDAFIADVDAHIVDGIDNPAKVVSAMNDYQTAKGDDKACQTRFGIVPAQVNALQGGGANKLGLYKDVSRANRIAIANDFYAALGQSLFFPETVFLG